MTIGLIDFLWGIVTVRVSERDSARALTILMRHNVPYRELRAGEDNSILLTLSKHQSKKLAPLGIQFEVARQRGVRFVLRRYVPRTGLIVGGLLFLLAIWFSTMFVWDINVTGNTAIGDMEIIEALEAEGCFIGAYKPRVNVYKIANEFPAKYGGVGWISVNLVGTTAEIQVAEYKAPEFPAKDERVYNLVASTDGVIVRFMTSSGQACMGVGEAVKAGETLVRGLYQRNDISIPGNAVGRVYARTTREFTVSVPYEYKVSHDEGETVIARSLNVLGIIIKIPTKNVHSDEIYGKIYRRERVTLFGGLIELPIWYNTIVFRPVTEITRTLTIAEAKDIAELRLADQIAALPDTEVVGYSTVILPLGDAYTIKATAMCVENIAIVEGATHDRP